LHREQVITRSGAKYLESFFAVVSRSVVVLANSEDLRGTNTQAMLDKFIDTWAGTSFAGVLVADNSGIVRYIANRARIGSQGESVKDRDYFNWALNSKQWEVKVFPPVLSRAGETRGKYIIPIAAPIFDSGGKFKGVVTAAVLMSDLARDYITPLQISSQSRSYLVAENGEVWFGSVGDFAGKNVLDELTGSFLGSDVLRSKAEGALNSHTEGKMEVALPSFGGGATWQTYLVAWSPLTLGPKSGYLVLVTPKRDALVYARPLYVRQIGMLFVVFAAILIISIRVAKLNTRAEEHQEHHIQSSI